MLALESSIAEEGDTALPELLTKLSFEGHVQLLLANPDRESGLEKHRVPEARLLFAGMEGDCHGGITRKSDSRMLKQYKPNTEVRNSRQLSILSAEELAELAPTCCCAAFPTLPCCRPRRGCSFPRAP
jgi:hypothetical protein